MSGGSYEYAFHHVEDFASALRGRSLNDPDRMAFAELLDRVAKAMYDIEWVDSGDKSDGDELPAIRACLAPGASLAMARQLTEAVAVAREAAGNCGCDGDPRCPLCDGLRARLAALQEEG